MSGNEFDKESLKVTVEAINQAYNTGFSHACQNIIDALGLVPAKTITKEDIIKLIGIVQRVSKSKQ